MTESLSRHTRPESWKLPRRHWAAKDDGCLLDPQTGGHPGGSVGGDHYGRLDRAAGVLRRRRLGDRGHPQRAAVGCGPDIALYIAGFENVPIRKVCL